MPKIMLVEDDHTMRSLLGTLLGMEGHTVVIPVLENLESIFDAIQNEKPDLVLLDVNLRHITGFDLMMRIKNDGDLKRTPILMSSGMDYRSECLAAGANGFLLKPYLPNDLIQLIDQILIPGNELEVEG
jgi:CheY-like chemotaxis protein